MTAHFHSEKQWIETKETRLIIVYNRYCYVEACYFLFYIVV